MNSLLWRYLGARERYSDTDSQTVSGYRGTPHSFRNNHVLLLYVSPPLLGRLHPPHPCRDDTTTLNQKHSHHFAGIVSHSRQAKQSVMHSLPFTSPFALVSPHSNKVTTTTRLHPHPTLFIKHPGGPPETRTALLYTLGLSLPVATLCAPPLPVIVITDVEERRASSTSLFKSLD